MLQTLRLWGWHKLSDLTPLAGLSSLQTLDLSRCKNISDLSPQLSHQGDGARHAVARGVEPSLRVMTARRTVSSLTRSATEPWVVPADAEPWAWTGGSPTRRATGRQSCHAAKRRINPGSFLLSDRNHHYVRYGQVRNPTSSERNCSFVSRGHEAFNRVGEDPPARFSWRCVASWRGHHGDDAHSLARMPLTSPRPAPD